MSLWPEVLNAALLFSSVVDGVPRPASLAFAGLHPISGVRMPMQPSRAR